MKDQAVIDFESEKISQRPAYPPKPVGLAVWLPGHAKTYYSWGHGSENGIFTLRGDKLARKEGDAKKLARAALRDAYRCESVLGHNVAKFDLDVGEVGLGVKPPPWHKVDDSLFSRFLVDPHAPTLSLKPSAEAVLGEAPEERDAVFEWLAQHGVIQKARVERGVLKYQKDAGAYISKAPGALVARYAIGDLTRSRGLWDHDMKLVKQQGMLEAYRREQQVAPILLDNERQGMRVDVPRLEQDLKIYTKALGTCREWLHKRLQVRGETNWNSDEEVADALARAGVVKKFPLTETGRRSVSKANLTKKFFEDQDVYLVMVYMNTVEYVCTQNIGPWLEQATQSGGKIFTIWNQVRSDKDSGGARSGRITCSKWQNIIKNPTSGMNPDYRKEDDARVRKLLKLPELPLARKYCLPDEGDLFVHRDWNQQELRLLAHYEDGRLAATYREDPAADIHGKVRQWMIELASADFDREPVKRANFLTAYGGGAPALSRRTGMSLDEARAFLAVWRRALPDVVALSRALTGMYERGEPVRTYGGRLYHCKPDSIAKKGDRKGQVVNFAYTALNYLLQPSGADLIKMAIIGYHEHPLRRGRMLSCVHDELNASAPKDLAKSENEVLREVMEGIKIDVPWRSDGDERPNWGEKAA